jgi:hypothetical protein
VGKSTISTGPFSMAMFDITRGYIRLYLFSQLGDTD